MIPTIPMNITRMKTRPTMKKSGGDKAPGQTETPQSNLLTLDPYKTGTLRIMMTKRTMASMKQITEGEPMATRPLGLQGGRRRLRTTKKMSILEDRMSTADEGLLSVPKQSEAVPILMTIITTMKKTTTVIPKETPCWTKRRHCSKILSAKTNLFLVHRGEETSIDREMTQLITTLWQPPGELAEKKLRQPQVCESMKSMIGEFQDNVDQASDVGMMTMTTIGTKSIMIRTTMKNTTKVLSPSTRFQDNDGTKTTRIVWK